MDYEAQDDAAQQQGQSGDDNVHENAAARRLREQIRPITEEHIKADGIYEDKESFFPYPAVTFMVDKPDNIVCQICLESRLSLGPHNFFNLDCMPAVMPCGHVAGRLCLETFLADKHDNDRACPFCRFPLIHPECEHGVRPKVLGNDGIMALPATIPAGGEVPDKCEICRWEDAMWRWTAIVADAREDVVQAKQRYWEQRTTERAAELMNFVNALDRVRIEATEEIQLVRHCIDSW